MPTFTPGELPAIAKALAQAYPTPVLATELLASINENFEALNDPADPHETRVEDTVAILASRGQLLLLMMKALADPQQAGNMALRQVLQPIAQQTKWKLLDTQGFVLRLGPFVDRSNLRSAIDRLFMGRRVLRVVGSGGIRGRSWSCQLIERQATLRGARYIHVDMRNAPLAARETPSWLAGKLYADLFPNPADLFPNPADLPSIVGVAESRLIDSLTNAWVPTARDILVVIDHLGDANVAQPVRECAVKLALAVVENRLPRLKLVLIDSPPEIDLARYPLQTAEDVVGPVTVEHVTEFFAGAAMALFPNAPPSRIQRLAEEAVAPLKSKLPAGASEELAIAVRDALEVMACRQDDAAVGDE